MSWGATSAPGNAYQPQGEVPSTRFITGRATWDFQPHSFPLISATERVTKVTDTYRRGPRYIFVLGIFQVIFVIGAAASGDGSYAIAHGIFSALLLAIGVYALMGQRRKVAILTSDRFVLRSMSTYGGLDHKHNTETTLWIRDLSSVRVRARWINWILVVGLLFMLGGFYTFTRHVSGLTIISLLLGIFFMGLFLFRLFKDPMYYVTVRATRGSAWDYSLSVPLQTAEEAYDLADAVMLAHAQHLAAQHSQPPRS